MRFVTAAGHPRVTGSEGLCYPENMIRRRCIVSVLLMCGALAAPTYGQTPANPDFLEQYAATYHFRLGRPGAIRPTPDGKSILFLRSGPRSFERTLYEQDVATGHERPLLTADQLLDGAEQTFTDEEEARRQRRRRESVWRASSFFRTYLRCLSSSVPSQSCHPGLNS